MLCVIVDYPFLTLFSSKTTSKIKFDLIQLNGLIFLTIFSLSFLCQFFFLPDVSSDDLPTVSCDSSTQTDDQVMEENVQLKRHIRELEDQLETEKKRTSPQLTEKDKLHIAKEVLHKPAWSRQQISFFLEDKKRTKWSQEDLVLGLTLRGLSRKVYKFLRERKLLPLPGLTTLKDHIRHFTCSPGILNNVLNGIQLLVQLSVLKNQ